MKAPVLCLAFSLATALAENDELVLFDFRFEGRKTENSVTELALTGDEEYG